MKDILVTSENSVGWEGEGNLGKEMDRVRA